MAAGEPSAEQLGKFSTLEEVATWTQMSPDVSGPFFKNHRGHRTGASSQAGDDGGGRGTRGDDEDDIDAKEPPPMDSSIPQD